MERLTIFTATYNRAEFLPRAYEALCKQSCKDFCWMIIDDGSTDNTKEVIEEFINQSPGFKIIYIYKPNGGLYTCYNTAIQYTDENSELMYCIDSDDWIAFDAVEIILKEWDSCKHKKDYAGIVGLAYLPDDTLIGTLLPGGTVNMNVGKMNKQFSGDRAVIVRTDLMKKYGPMPEFEGEKDFNAVYLEWKICEDYDFYSVNKCLMYKEYQQTGMSANLFVQYMRSPNSFMEMRRQVIDSEDIPIGFALRQAIHYVSSCIFAKKYLSIWTGTKRPLLCTCCLVPGVLLNIYVRYRVKSNRKNRILKAEG